MTKLRHTLLSLLAVLLLVTIIIAIFSSSSARAQEDNDEDDGVVDVEENDDGESDSRRSRRFGGGEQFENFEDFTRKQKKSSDNNNKQKKKKSSSDDGKQKKDQQQQQSPKRKPSFTPPPPSSSSNSKLSLTERLALLTKGLNSVKGGLTGTANRLSRLSSSDVESRPATLHFNSSINRPGSLKLLSKLLSAFGLPHVVDSDALESANSQLSTLRQEHYSITKKVEAAAKKKAKEGENKNDFPARDIKIQELKQGVAVAGSIIDMVVELEEKQRVLHKRLMRAGKLVLPGFLRYVDKIVALADDRYNEIRGIRSGDIDGAAPSASASDARRVREERRKFSHFVKRLKAAQSIFRDFARHLEGQQRRGRGVTKAMEPLYVLAHLLVRHGLCDDVLPLLAAGDALTSNKHGEIDPLVSAFGAVIAADERLLDSAHALDLAQQGVAQLSPATTIGVVLGLEASELMGIVLAVVVPMLVVRILYNIIESRIVAMYEKKVVALGGGDKKKKFPGGGQKLGSSSNSKTSNSSNSSAKPSLLWIFLMFTAQLLFLLVPVDVPLVADRVEDISILPIKASGIDVTLPSVLFAALRLQAGNGTQWRFVGLLLGMILFQAYSMAASIAKSGVAVAEYERRIHALEDGDDDDSDDDATRRRDSKKKK